MRSDLEAKIREIESQNSSSEELSALVGNASMWTADPAWRSAMGKHDQHCGAAWRSFRDYTCPTLLSRVGHGLALYASSELTQRAASFVGRDES